MSLWSKIKSKFWKRPNTSALVPVDTSEIERMEAAADFYEMQEQAALPTGDRLVSLQNPLGEMRHTQGWNLQIESPLEAVLCLGDEDMPVLFSAASSYPILEKHYRAQKRLEVLPKPVRVDTDETYLGYLASRPSTEPVTLSLPPFADGKVNCWKEDDLVCASIRLPGPDGKTRIATTSAALDEHAIDVLGAELDGMDPIDAIDHSMQLATVLGAGALVSELAEAAPSILDLPGIERGEPVYGLLAPTGNPELAAVMALEQDAEHDDTAKAELSALAEVPSVKPLIAESKKRLRGARR